MKKKSIIFIIMLLTTFMFMEQPSFACEPINTTTQRVENIESRKYIYEWKYKVVNGKLYKRLFNVTTGQWIGNWELC